LEVLAAHPTAEIVVRAPRPAQRHVDRRRVDRRLSPAFGPLYADRPGRLRLSLDLFTDLPPAGFELGGGFGNAIVGTLAGPSPR
jgi:hypothetical protein